MKEFQEQLQVVGMMEEETRGEEHNYNDGVSSNSRHSIGIRRQE